MSLAYLKKIYKKMEKIEGKYKQDGNYT